jgi:hypothetical protein
MEHWEYYKQVEVLFEIVKQLQGREVALLCDDYNVRCIKAHNLAFLESNFRAFNFFKRKYNIYISSAHFNNMPLFSYDPKTRQEQSHKFRDTYKDFMTGYDFFIDIDGDPKDISGAYIEAKKIKEFFDAYKLPYYIKLSGKGFHFIIMSHFFSGIFPDLFSRNLKFKTLVLSLKKLLNLSLLDITVYDLRRVYKVAYSLDTKTGRVALPLSDEQFNNFDISCVLPENVLKNGVRNRGLLIRNQETDYTKNLKKFVSDIS